MAFSALPPIGPGGPQPAARPQPPSTTGTDTSFLDTVTEGVGNLAGGVALGVAKDPIVNLAIRSIFPDATEDFLGGLEDAVGNTQLGDIGEFIGEFGSLLIPAVGAGMIGRKVVSKAFQQYGGRLAAKTAEAAALRNAGKAFNLTGLERAVQITGESLGIGAFEGSRSLADPDGTYEEAAKDALIGAGLTFGIGAGITYGAKILFPGGSFADFSKLGDIKNRLLKANIEKADELKKLISKEADELANNLGVPSLELEIAEAMGAKTGAPLAAKQLSFAGMADDVGGFKPVQFERMFRRGGDVLEQEIKDLGLEESGKAFIVRLVSKLPHEAGTKATGSNARQVITKGNSLYKNIMNEKILREMEIPDHLLTRVMVTKPYSITGWMRVGKEKTEGILAQAEAAEKMGRRGRALALKTKGKYFGLKDDFHGWHLGLRDFFHNLTAAPENILRRMGVAGTKMAQMGVDFDASVKVGRLMLHNDMVGMAEAARKGLGNVSHKKARESWILAGRLWEKTNDMGAVERQFAKHPKFVDQFKRLIAAGDKVDQDLAKSGFVIPRTAGQQAEMGQPGFMSLLFDDTTAGPLGEVRLLKAIKTNFKRTRGIELSDDRAREIMGSHPFFADGQNRFSMTAFQRQLRGTTKELIDDGFPIVEDPLQAMTQYRMAALARVESAKRFGPDGQVAEYLRDAAIKEAGVEASGIMNTLTDHILMRTHHKEALKNFANNLTSAQVVTKMTFGAIPNFFQNYNNVMTLGMKAQLKGTVSWLKGQDRAAVLEALGLIETGALHTTRDMIIGFQPRTFMEKFAEKTLKMTGFSYTETMNRVVTGNAVMHYLDDIVKKGSNLRGTARVTARKAFSEMDLDLDAIVSRGRILPEETAKAIRAGVRKTQFQNGLLDVPIFWRTPVGRVMFQFKTFAFNQSKLLRDGVINEAANGNYKPLAYMMSFYPVTGELVADSVQMLKGKGFGTERDKDGVWRVVENMANMGGFGISWNAFVSGRFGDFESFALGPTFADTSSLVESIIQLDRPGVFHNNLRRQPAFAAGSQGAKAFGGLAAEGASSLNDMFEELMGE